MPHRVPLPRCGIMSHTQSSSPAHGETGKYRLILRDLFTNHHLCGPKGWGHDAAASSASAGRRVLSVFLLSPQHSVLSTQSCVPPKDLLFIAPEDAALLHIAAGESRRIESADGAVTRPVTIKAGIKTGVLECVLGDTLRQGVPIRSEMLALSLRPSKVIAVSVRKV